MSILCKSCNLAIKGPSMLACGDCYHTSCFICSACLQPFPDGVFLQHEGLLFCESDYNELIADKCGKCGRVIDGECINALDTRWHKDCFCCVDCGEVLRNGVYLRFKDKQYCRNCHDIAAKNEQNEAKNLCLRCKKTIDGQAFLYKEGKYHAYHFFCSLCKKELKPDCKEFEGKLYCPEDYIKVTAPTCYACKRLVLGMSITALGKAFHPEHFVCFKCEQPFENSVFWEHKGKAYCLPHYHELTGTRCHRCLCIIDGDVVEGPNKNKYCANHFLCMGCDKNMAGKSYGVWDEKPICQGCYNKIPIKIRKRVNDYFSMEKKMENRGIVTQ